MKQHLAVMLAAILAALVSPSAGMAVLNKRGVWHDPCGKSVSPKHMRLAEYPQRHELNKLYRAILAPVKTQIGIANKYFKKEQNNINQIYNKVMELDPDIYRFDWLPQKPMQWYKNQTRCLDKDKRVAKVLQSLHSSLRLYSLTFQELQKFDKSEISPENESKIRNRLIDGMASHLNQVLCEVDYGLLQVLSEVDYVLFNLEVQRPTQEEDDFLHNKLDRWVRNPDHTSSLIQDWGVISLYRNFLEEWFLIIQKVHKPAGCKAQDNSRRRKKPKQ